MKETRCAWRFTGARVVSLGMVIALAPLPVAAAESGQPSQPASSLRNASFTPTPADRTARPRLDRTQTPAAGSAADIESPSFFRTKVGIAVIAIVGAGTGYALYSANRDRIHSSSR